MGHPFDYDEAFSRNLGWISSREQSLLRSKRIAIAGLGGVGGSHLLTLSRLGIGAFHLADFDVFELANFNRQAGATVSTLGQSKTGVLAEMARDINPELDLKIFPQGIRGDNLRDFLQGVDLYLDSLDFFAVDARRAVFHACEELGIPAVTAAPLGMGTAVLNFLPGGMGFEEYFRLEGQPEGEQLLRFLLGLSPAMLQGQYLVDPTRVDLAAKRGPSTAMACELCAGVAATQVLKILLGRGKVLAAPRGLHFDAYRNKLTRTWRPWGNRNPLQRLGLLIARHRLDSIQHKNHQAGETPT
jgi:molybdopterin/thiamine biosynthesis adenylyltransferase